MGKAIVTVDDLDHQKPATETIRFSFEGTNYVIDLGPENASEMRALFGKYTAVARDADKDPDGLATLTLTDNDTAHALTALGQSTDTTTTSPAPATATRRRTAKPKGATKTAAQRKGTRTGTKTAAPTGRTAKIEVNAATRKVIREWAEDQPDIDLAPRGQIPAAVIQRYFDQHGRGKRKNRMASLPAQAETGKQAFLQGVPTAVPA